MVGNEYVGLGETISRPENDKISGRGIIILKEPIGVALF
jgi:hypothetical protein